MHELALHCLLKAVAWHACLPMLFTAWPVVQEGSRLVAHNQSHCQLTSLA